MHRLQKETWSDEATVTSEQATFYLEYHSSSTHDQSLTGSDGKQCTEKTARMSDNTVMLETLAAYVKR